MLHFILSAILTVPLLMDTHTVTGKYVRTKMLLIWPVTQFIIENSVDKVNCRVTEEDYGKAVIGKPFQCRWRKDHELYVPILVPVVD